MRHPVTHQNLKTMRAICWTLRKLFCVSLVIFESEDTANPTTAQQSYQQSQHYQPPLTKYQTKPQPIKTYPQGFDDYSHTEKLDSPYRKQPNNS